MQKRCLTFVTSNSDVSNHCETEFVSLHDNDKPSSYCAAKITYHVQDQMLHVVQSIWNNKAKALNDKKNRGLEKIQ